MSRENRRRAAAAGSVAQPEPAPPVAATESGRTVSWRHCLIGLLAGEVILLVISNAALWVANLAFGSNGTDAVDGGIVGVSTLLAVIAGGYIAGRLAHRFELYQGVVVAIGFIAIGALFQFLQEAQIVHSALASGGHYLVDLGPMSMGNLISGDFLALFGGSVGGLFAARRPR